MRQLGADEYYDILSLDWEYRQKTRQYVCSSCGTAWTPKHIRDTECPKCGANDILVPQDESGYTFVKTNRIQLPVLDNHGGDKGVNHYRLMYSNTDNAWSQKKTRDWVVAYVWFKDDDYHERHTYTVITDGNSVRIVVGQPDPREGKEKAEWEEPSGEQESATSSEQNAAPPSRPAIDLDEEITGDLQSTAQPNNRGYAPGQAPWEF